MGIIGRDPSVSNKSNQLHVDVFPVLSFVGIIFFGTYQFEVYSVNSCKMVGNFGRISAGCFSHSTGASVCSGYMLTRFGSFICLFVLFVFEVYSVNFWKMVGNFGRIWNSSRLFLTLNRCICV